MEIEQSFRQQLQPLQRQRTHRGFLACAQGATASAEQARRQLLFPFLPAIPQAFLPALLPSLAKDLPVRHALAEVFQGDAPMAQSS